MEWELSKENVQPLREGRNVEKLNAALKARAAGPMKSKILEQHRKMVEAIDDYDGDDPLKPWLECIQWVKEAYPSGGTQSGLLQLLELCARTFWSNKNYSNDLRYLKVWMEYADRCTNPGGIFSFLQKNNIGQEHALFYEHCARFWEQQHKLSRANDTFQVGIARKAQPYDRLKNAYIDFLNRSARASKLKDEASSPTGAEMSNRAFGTDIAGRVLGQPSQQARKQKSSTMQRTTAGGIPVFVDPKFRSKNTGSANEHISGSTYNSTTSRNIFIAESESSKENTQLATKWLGTKIPQKAVLPSLTPVKLDVFKDEQFSHINLAEQTCVKKAVPASRFLRLDDVNDLKREADRLKQSPLVHFVEDGHSFPDSDEDCF